MRASTNSDSRYAEKAITAPGAVMWTAARRVSVGLTTHGRVGKSIDEAGLERSLDSRKEEEIFRPLFCWRRH